MTTCATCTRLKSDPEVGTLAQIKFVDLNPKRRRNRSKIGANFTATLPNAIDSTPVEDFEEDFEEEPADEQLATPRPLAPAASAETSTAPTSTDSTSASHTPTESFVLELTSTASISAALTRAPTPTPMPTPTTTPTPTPMPTPTPTETATPRTISTIQPETNIIKPEFSPGKLQKVIADLKVTAIPIAEELRRQLVQVVSGSLDAFAATPSDLGRTSVIVHKIKTIDGARPVRHKLRAIFYARRQFLEQEVEKLLAVNAVSDANPGECPYASRTVITPKKDGSFRMCVDYRDLNAQTKKDLFQLPRRSSLADDLESTFLRVPRSAHGLPPGRGRAERSPQNWFPHASRAVLLQRDALRPVQCTRDVLVFLDDVLVYAGTPEELLESLQQVLRLLAGAGLKCKASKCALFTQKVYYLGHVVSKDGINLEPDKLDKIRQWPRPERGTGLASFLGYCNYYRDLILSFAHISEPLYKASKRDIIDWDANLNANFEKLKSMISEPRIVRLPDPERSFILETDGRTVALGAVLKQKFDDTNLEHPVGFFSRTLSGSERNYCAYEIVMYALVRAVEHFRMFLLGR